MKSEALLAEFALFGVSVEPGPEDEDSESVEEACDCVIRNDCPAALLGSVAVNCVTVDVGKVPVAAPETVRLAPSLATVTFAGRSENQLQVAGGERHGRRARRSSSNSRGRSRNADGFCAARGVD